MFSLSQNKVCLSTFCDDVSYVMSHTTYGNCRNKYMTSINSTVNQTSYKKKINELHREPKKTGH